MNVSRHVAVLWRFKIVAIVGLIFGLLLAVVASYHVAWKSGPALIPRGSELWTANSSILVTQPGFPEGRVTLPEKEAAAALAAARKRSSGPHPNPDKELEFADPARLAGLADLYSRFLLTDEVLSRASGGVKADDVAASPFAASQGGQILPVIQLTATAPSEALARQRNLAVFRALGEVLAERQGVNAITPERRVEIRLINAPKPILTAGVSHTMSILALALSLLGAVAVAHLLAALRGEHRKVDDDVLAPPISWSAEPPVKDREPPEGVTQLARARDDGDASPPTQAVRQRR